LAQLLEQAGAARYLSEDHFTVDRHVDRSLGEPQKLQTEGREAVADRRLYLTFDHPTMTATPRENVDWFLESVPEGTKLDLDVLTHSRGGLVARRLVEKQTVLATHRDVSIENLVLTGAPDGGTALGDAKYMGDFVDAYTNLISFFPDTVTVDVLHCVLEAVKEIAMGTLGHLSGLQSMAPGGTFQTWLNAGPKTPSRYFAVAAKYEPSEPALLNWAKQRLMHTIFRKDNDLVVPTSGVYDSNGAGAFPIRVEDRLLFETAECVWHCNYLAQQKLHAKLGQWLPGNA